MKNGKPGSKMALAGVGIALIAAAAVAYDGNSGPSQATPPDWFAAHASILQYQKDSARNRGWILTPAGVFVVDLKARRTVKHVPLPDWHWAGEPYGCTPTLALGPKGTALVSSDVVPTLWRIDAESLAVSKHELVLEQESGREVGFSGLAYSARLATYIAKACAQGSAWRIDAFLKAGQKAS